MNSDQWLRYKKIFSTARKLVPGEREQYLEEACHDNEELKKQVEQLLGYHESSENFLNIEDPAPVLDLTLTRIGQYLLKRIISSGGMGTVYEALQENPRRKVAVKVLRSGAASKRALRRFEYESEILARLTHPNIAKVIEAGTHREEGEEANGGTPYFVMEYIEEARPLTEYASENNLSVTERLRLFLEVCDALHHGHQKGIIHRDLKPSNLLIDAEGTVKVIDFGIARVTDSDIHLTTAHTAVGMLIGTLQYMSPEQCIADPNDLDVRSDVYALGVVLYELLCEQLPYNVEKTAIFEATRIVREDPPKRPSTVDRRLKGDIETMVLKALEKDRKHRYQSVTEFADDLERYLRGDLILAKPAGPATRAWKQIKRNPVLATGLGTAVLAAVFFMVYILLVSYPQLKHERDIAETERQKAVEAMEETDRQRVAALEAKEEAELQRVAALEAKASADREVETNRAINEFLRNMLASARPDREGREVKVVELLEGAAEELEGAFPDQPEIEGALLNTIGITYFVLGKHSEAEPLLRTAVAEGIEAYGEEHPLTLVYTSDFCRVLRSQGQYSEAESLLRKTVAAQQRILGHENKFTLHSRSLLAWVLLGLGQADDAESILLEVLKVQPGVMGEEHNHTLTTREILADVLLIQGRYPEAEKIFRDLTEIRTRLHGDDHPQTLQVMNNLAIALNNDGKHAEAESMHRRILEKRIRSLGEENLPTLETMANLAMVLMRQGRFAEAESMMRKTLAITRKVHGDVHPATFTCMGNLGCVLGYQNKHVEAEAIFKELCDALSNSLGEKNPKTLSAMSSLSAVYSQQGKWSESASMSRRVLEAQRRLLGDERHETLVTMENLSMTLMNMSEFEEAEALIQEVLETRQRLQGHRHPNMLKALNTYAHILNSRSKYAEAETLYNEALEILEELFGTNHPETLYCLNGLASSIMKQDRFVEAEPLFRRGYQAALKSLPKSHELYACFPLNLGRLCWELKQYPEAEEYLLKAYDAFSSVFGLKYYWTQLTVQHLVDLYEEWGEPEKAKPWRKKLIRDAADS